jgi:hypothetical protein
MNKCLPIIALALSGCAAQVPLNVQTASGNPEGLFRNTTVANVQTLIADKCLSKPGRTIEDVSAMQVTCAADFPRDSVMRSVGAQLYVGGDDSAQVQVKVRYSLLQRGADVRVVANCWLQNRSPLGSDVKRAFMDNNLQNTIHASLVSLGAE